MSDLTIRAYPELPAELWNDCRALHEQAMAPLAVLAANRHTLNDTEFVHMFVDTRITKWVALTAHGSVAAFATMLTDLHAWPLLSPEFFAARWPEEHDAGRIFYCGFVCTNRHTPGAFAEIIRAMSADARAGGGLIFLDFCDHNVETRNAPRVIERILTSEHLHQREIDAQRFWLFSFDKPEVIS